MTMEPADPWPVERCERQLARTAAGGGSPLRRALAAWRARDAAPEAIGRMFRSDRVFRVTALAGVAWLAF